VLRGAASAATVSDGETQRVRKANDSEPQIGQCCSSCTSSQSKHSRAFIRRIRCSIPGYSRPISESVLYGLLTPWCNAARWRRGGRLPVHDLNRNLMRSPPRRDAGASPRWLRRLHRWDPGNRVSGGARSRDLVAGLTPGFTISCARSPSATTPCSSTSTRG
jgi:hypothetical protein